MTVHFICRGNTYRSRLAETYLNSLNLENIHAISSGIEAKKDLSGPVTWYAQRIIENNHLQKLEKPIWQQTTNELLDNSDLNIFMYKDIYDFCVENLSFNKSNYEVWDIQDMQEEGRSEEDLIQESDDTFAKIKQRVEALVARLQQE